MAGTSESRIPRRGIANEFERGKIGDSRRRAGLRRSDGPDLSNTCARTTRALPAEYTTSALTARKNRRRRASNATKLGRWLSANANKLTSLRAMFARGRLENSNPKEAAHTCGSGRREKTSRRFWNDDDRSDAEAGSNILFGRL